ncbi:MAG: glycosyltransferase family 2 protein [Ignavibacteria bacterium]|nr:glycosyltransferase family 2 protein [Ignavibacteria bacterium]
MSQTISNYGPSPAICIGLPVYNGARFLSDTLNSLLGQSFSDFELIISDNASTDETERICRDFAMLDPRIRYIRQPVNIGAMRNANFVANQGRSKYFKWSSASDYCAPDMLTRCFAAMEANPDIILCYGRTCLVNDETGKLEEYAYDIDVMENRPHDRFLTLRRGLRLNNAYCGLIRTNALHQTRLNRIYAGGDIVLMAELALMGRFLLLPEVLLFRRMGHENFSGHLKPADLAYFIDPQKSHNIGLPLLSWHLGFLGAALRAPISIPEKMKTLMILLRHAAWDREKLWAELRGAVRK